MKYVRTKNMSGVSQIIWVITLDIVAWKAFKKSKNNPKWNWPSPDEFCILSSTGTESVPFQLSARDESLTPRFCLTINASIVILKRFAYELSFFYNFQGLF